MGDVFLLPFSVGALIAFIVFQFERIDSVKISIALILLGLYLLGYKIPEVDYSWVAPLASKFNQISVALNTIGSAGIILGIMNSSRIYHFMDTRNFRVLGELSFSLYLIHILVLCSFSSFLFLHFNNVSFSGVLPLLINFVATIFLSLLFSIPLAILDRKWVRFINRSTDYIVSKKIRALNNA